MNHKGGNFFTTIFHDFALICRGVIGRDCGWGAVIAKTSVHELVHKVQLVGGPSGGPMGSTPESGVEKGGWVA